MQFQINTETGDISIFSCHDMNKLTKWLVKKGMSVNSILHWNTKRLDFKNILPIQEIIDADNRIGTQEKNREESSS